MKTKEFKIGDKVIIEKNSVFYGDFGWRAELQNQIKRDGFLIISAVNGEYANFRNLAYGISLDSLIHIDDIQKNSGTIIKLL